jgi:nucleoside-diphosphate-sugar epimerase
MQEFRFLLTGASGWFGRTALWEYEKMMGPEALRRDVAAFASTDKNIYFGSPYGAIQARPLNEIASVGNPHGLLHLAFLTRERVASEGLDAYISKNRAITAAVNSVLSQYPRLPIVTTSSGAAGALDGKDPDLSANPYATLKQEEEGLWRQNAELRMAVVFRVYAATGRFMKDYSLFALGDFLSQAKAGNPIILRNPRQVIRSYVHVGTLMRLAWRMLQNPLSAGYRRIDAVTETLSLKELAELITSYWDLPPIRCNLDLSLEPDSYVGDSASFCKILSRYHLRSLDLKEQILETAIGVMD